MGAVRMSEMVERVARAISYEINKLIESGQITISPTADFSVKPIGRVAMEAMRDPSQEMLFVGSNDEVGYTTENLKISWQLMIDEALKPSEGAVMEPGTLFLPFSEAPTYAAALRLVPGAAIVARTFGGYIAFSSMELYHLWMRDR
jgi:hypothetical protein